MKFRSIEPCDSRAFSFSDYERLILLRVSITALLTQIEVKWPLKQLSITPHAWHSPRGLDAVVSVLSPLVFVPYAAHYTHSVLYLHYCIQFAVLWPRWCSTRLDPGHSSASESVLMQHNWKLFGA